MPAGNYNISIEQGATFTLGVGYQDGSGLAVNLTGYTADMQVRSTVGNSVIQYELSTTNGRITITPLTGIVTLNLTATETTALTFQSGVYDIELTSGATVIRLLQGTITVSPGVTR